MQVSLKSVDISVFYAREVSMYKKQRSKRSFGAPSISQLKIISSFILEKLFVMPKKYINQPGLQHVWYWSFSDPEG